MSTRYSPSFGTFYPPEIDYPNLPSDLIEVSMADFEAAMHRPAGHTFNFLGGKLIISPPEPEPIADILARALAEIRVQRVPILNALDGIAGRTYRAGDTATAAAADEAIDALRDITKLPALLQATSYDDMRAAVLARYRQIAGAAPAIVQSAFIEIAAS